jgi:hypothetical protein
MGILDKLIKRNASKKMLSTVKKNLNNIWLAADEIARGWNKESIPLTTLNVILDNATPKDTDNDFAIAYAADIQNFKKVCNKVAKEMNAKEIPISQVKEGVVRLYQQWEDTFLAK